MIVRVHVVCFSFLLFGALFGATAGADPAPSSLPPLDPAAVRSPAPIGLALDRAERRVKDAYDTELADTSEAGRRKLLQTMLDDAAQTRDDAAARYVLLKEARRVASSLNDAATADYITHQIEALYSLVGQGSAANPDSFDAIATAISTKVRPRLPAPAEASVTLARKKLRTKYAAYYADASPLVRSALLTKLLGDADGASEALDQYAALRESAEVAAGIGDLKTATQCASTLATVYQIDETDVRLAILTTAAPHSGKTIPARDLAWADLNLADDAAKANNFDVATKALSLAQAVLPAAGDESFNARHKKREKEIREARDEYVKVALVLKKLADSPDDKDLNAKAGRYFCLVAGDWAKGVPMLMKGSDTAMKVLAEAELTTPTATDAQLRLGDSWWDRSSAESGANAQRCKQRAGYWYRRVKASSPSAVPERVTSRMLSTARSTDLLAMMNPARDKVSGQWTGGKTGMSTTNALSGRLQFPYTPPEEYDYVVQFTLHRTINSVAQIVPIRDTYFAWTMGTTHAAFETMVVGMSRATYYPFTFAPMKQYTSVLEVRKTGIRAMVNGTVVADWKTDFTDLIPPNAWKLNDPRLLGFGSSFSDVTLQSAKVIELGAENE